MEKNVFFSTSQVASGYVFDDHRNWDACFPLGCCPEPSEGEKSSLGRKGFGVLGIPTQQKLAGGFKDFLFSPLFGDDFQFDEHIFPRG